MPPWDNISATERMCVKCQRAFSSKRPAKYCSPLCANRSRPVRPYDGDYRRPYHKQRRVDKGDILRTQERNRYASVQEFIRSVKIDAGCADCGYREHHAALDFDHLSDKQFNVCNAKSISQALREISKCEVVCANCHRLRTFNRLQQVYPCKPDVFALTYEPVQDRQTEG